MKKQSVAFVCLVLSFGVLVSSLSFRPATRSIATAQEQQIANKEEAELVLKEAESLLESLKVIKESKITDEKSFEEFRVKEQLLADSENSLVRFLSNLPAEEVEEFEAQLTLLSLNISSAKLYEVKQIYHDQQREKLQKEVEAQSEELSRLREQQCEKESEILKLKQEVSALIAPQEKIIETLAPVDMSSLMAMITQLQQQVSHFSPMMPMVSMMSPAFAMSVPYMGMPMMNFPQPPRPYYEAQLAPMGFFQYEPPQIEPTQNENEQMTRVIPSFNRTSVQPESVIQL